MEPIEKEGYNLFLATPVFEEARQSEGKERQISCLPIFSAGEAEDEVCGCDSEAKAQKIFPQSSFEAWKRGLGR